MSTPAQLITKAQRKTYAGAINYPSADAIIDLNDRLDILYSRIQTEVDEGHYWNYMIANLVAGQSEYAITPGTFSLAINQIDGISVKWNSTDADFTKLNKVDYNSLDFDMQSYANWAGEPFYFIKDQSVFIYPAPQNSVTNGYKIFSINQPAQVTAGGTEADIKIAPRFHNIIVTGMIADYWFQNGNEAKGEEFENKFNKQGDDMIKYMKNRSQEPMEYVVSLNPYE